MSLRLSQKEGTVGSSGWPSVPELRPQGMVVGNLRGAGLRLGGQNSHTGRCREKEIVVYGRLGLSQWSPLFPQGLDGGSSLSYLVHLSISNTTIRFLSSSRTFHSSPLPTGEIPHPSASLPGPDLLLLNCSDQTCPFSFPQTLSAFLLLCLCSLGCSEREQALK